jgi:hypothetical protein
MNVAGLLLAWLPGRLQEFLVRMALGASGARVLRQILLETLIWAIAGSAVGLVIANRFLALFGAVGVSSALPYDFEPSIDGRVIVTTAILLLVSVCATAIGPSVLAVRRSKDLTPRRASAAGVFGGRVTVALQVALSIVRAALCRRRPAGRVPAPRRAGAAGWRRPAAGDGDLAPGNLPVRRFEKP